MNLTARLLDDVQSTLVGVNGLSVPEIHHALAGRYDQRLIGEALEYLMAGDKLGRVVRNGAYFRLAVR